MSAIVSVPGFQSRFGPPFSSGQAAMLSTLFDFPFEERHTDRLVSQLAPRRATSTKAIEMAARLRTFDQIR